MEFETSSFIHSSVDCNTVKGANDDLCFLDTIIYKIFCEPNSATLGAILLT